MRPPQCQSRCGGSGCGKKPGLAGPARAGEPTPTVRLDPDGVLPGAALSLSSKEDAAGPPPPFFSCKHGKWGMELATGQNSGLYRIYRNEARGVIAHDTCVPRAGATTRDETALEELWFPVPSLLQWSPGRSNHKV